MKEKKDENRKSNVSLWRKNSKKQAQVRERHQNRILTAILLISPARYSHNFVKHENETLVSQARIMPMQ